MNVIRGRLHLLTLNPVMLWDLKKYLFLLPPYISTLNPFLIFGHPYQMIVRIVKRMAILRIATRFPKPYFF